MKREILQFLCQAMPLHKKLSGNKKKRYIKKTVTEKNLCKKIGEIHGVQKKLNVK